MEFSEKDASAFAKLREEKKAQVSETRLSLKKRSRHLAEQSALLKHDISTFKNDLAAIGLHDYLTGVAHVCECAPLCPAVWSTLPLELLQHVFARLPLPDIIRLRVLSKTWDRYVTGVTPGFTKLCAESSPNMFAMVYNRYTITGYAVMDIKFYNSNEKRWHYFVHQTRGLHTCITMFASDGGLVCLFCTALDKNEIVVFNPLTRQCRELPSSSFLSQIQPRMVQLVMDQDSKCYKVLVVGHKKQGGGDVVAGIFSSATGKWSEPNIFSDLIFGRGDGMVMGRKVVPCAYDCASSTFLELQDGSYGVESHDTRVLVKDRLFVLDEDGLGDYRLKEYQAQILQPHWVELNVLDCDELGATGYRSKRKMQLFGCQDFLLVYAFYYGYRETRTLLFDLSTSLWQRIFEIPAWSRFHYARNGMVKLRWDVVP